MANQDLKALTLDELRKKERELRIFMWIFVPLIIALFYPVVMDLINGDEIDMPILIIAICTVGGQVSIYPDLKKVREEIKIRNGVEEV